MALRPKLNRVWTSNNSIARRDPGDVKYLQGWVAEIPTYQVLNYLQYKVDTTMLAQAERGIFEWGSDVSYGVGSLAWDETNKTIYVCTVTNPSKTLAPSANPSQWSPSSIQVSRANYDSIVSAINNHIANLANPHQVTAAQVGTYNRAEMDALVANYQAMVQAHVTDYNNPHKLTAVQVGAVPVEGGTYTGEVTMPTAYFNESKTAQLLQDNGLWLKNGSYLLGINGTTGNPETGTAASKSRLVTELNFPDVKLAQEPGYAHLEPTFQMNLVNSLNIVRGSGTVSSTEGMNIQYDQANGGVFLFDQSGMGHSISGSDELVAIGDNVQYTIAFDYYPNNPLSTAVWQFTLGLGGYKVLLRANNNLVLEIRTSSGVDAHRCSNPYILPPLKWSRIVATHDGTTYRLFVDGVKIAEEAGGFATHNNSYSRMFFANFAANIQKSTRLRGFRLWPYALTDKQVSTL